MCIDKPTREALYRSQQIATGQCTFCTLSLQFFDFKLSQIPRVFLQRPSVKAVLAQLTPIQKIYAHSDYLEGHTSGKQKGQYITLISSVIHTRITTLQNAAKVNDHGHAITRNIAREFLETHWERVCGVLLPESREHTDGEIRPLYRTL